MYQQQKAQFEAIFGKKELVSDGAFFVDCDMLSVTVIKGNNILIWGSLTKEFHTWAVVYGVLTGEPLNLPGKYESTAWGMSRRLSKR